MSDLSNKIEKIKQNIKEFPDFPKPGILFRDIFSVFQYPELLQSIREVFLALATQIKPPVECVVGVESRGFLLGPLLALDLKVPFVPIRKKGKLPGKLESVSYLLEYGEDTLEIQSGSIQKSQLVLIVDDLLATGGSLSASCKLVEKVGGEVASCLVLMELTELKGRSNVPANVISAIKY